MEGSCEYAVQQSRTADKEWSFSLLVLGGGLLTPHHKTISVIRNEGKVAGSCGLDNEASVSVKGGEFLDQLSDY
jgi:hypothetical protein